MIINYPDNFIFSHSTSNYSLNKSSTQYIYLYSTQLNYYCPLPTTSYSNKPEQKSVILKPFYQKIFEVVGVYAEKIVGLDYYYIFFRHVSESMYCMYICLCYIR